MKLGRFSAILAIILTVISGGLAIPFYLLNYGSNVILNAWLFNAFQFGILTVVAYAIIISGKMPTDTIGLLTRYMGTIGLKMFVGLGFFFIGLKVLHLDKLTMGLAFFMAWVVCTTYEVYVVMRNLRHN